MSKDHSTVVCIHGMGLACDSCYDQTFGPKWKLIPPLTDAEIRARHTLVVGQHRATEYTHPHLNNNTES